MKTNEYISNMSTDFFSVAQGELHRFTSYICIILIKRKDEKKNE